MSCSCSDMFCVDQVPGFTYWILMLIDIYRTNVQWIAVMFWPTLCPRSTNVVPVVPSFGISGSSFYASFGLMFWHFSLATDQLSKPDISNDWIWLDGSLSSGNMPGASGNITPPLNKHLQGICFVAANSPTRNHSSSRLRKLDLLMKARESDPQNCRVRKALKPLYLGWGCFVEELFLMGWRWECRLRKKRWPPQKEMRNHGSAAMVGNSGIQV